MQQRVHHKQVRVYYKGLAMQRLVSGFVRAQRSTGLFWGAMALELSSVVRSLNSGAAAE